MLSYSVPLQCALAGLMDTKTRDQLLIIDELRRRKVLRSTTIYAVLGWCLLQWSNVLIGHMGWPTWSVTLILTLIVLGFPVVVALSWAFDITAEGVKRTNPAENPELIAASSSRRVTAVVVVCLAATLGLLVIG
jgi:adenylate cyclase